MRFTRIPLAVGLPEQLRREFPEVIAPVDPRVGAGRFLVDHVVPVLLEHLDRGPRGLKEKIFLSRGEPQKLEPLLAFGVVLFWYLRKRARAKRGS